MVITRRPGKSKMTSYDIERRGGETQKRRESTPETIRTSDTRLRRPLLYPAELRGHLTVRTIPIPRRFSNCYVGPLAHDQEICYIIQSAPSRHTPRFCRCVHRDALLYVITLMRMAHRRLQCLLHALCLLCFILTGCGYTVAGTSPDTATTRLALAVPPVTNHSREPGMERYVTSALRQALVRRQVFTLVAASVAPHRLHGVVQRVQIDPVSFDERDNAVQYRIEARMRIRLASDSTKRPLINQEIAAWAEYLVLTTSGAIRENVVAREAALHRLAQDLADKCVALLEITLF